MAMAPTMYPPEAPSQGPLNVEVMPDGAPQQPMGPQPPQQAYGGGHRQNLADMFEDDELRKIASELIEQVEADNQTRAEWLDNYTSGLDYLGFKGEDRSQPFKGSSGVYHPLLTEIGRA